MNRAHQSRPRPAHDGADGGNSHQGHAHQHAPTNHNRAFAVGVVLNMGFVAVEAVFGVLAGSLALVADAGHNLSDVLALLLAWGAALLSRRLPTARRTYGLRRSSILSALANAVALFVVVGGVTWEAIRRLQDPEPVAGGIVIAVAAFGVLINGVSAALFLSGSKEDMNLRGAFLHLASDAAVSVGVVIAGAAILATGWLWLDPAVSIGISLVILLGTWGLLKDAFNLALDAVPNHIDPAAVVAYLSSVPGVRDVHDLHIWGMSTTETALTVHLVMGQGPNDVLLDDALLGNIREELAERFEIHHATVQLEQGDPLYPCELAPASIV